MPKTDTVLGSGASVLPKCQCYGLILLLIIAATSTILNSVGLGWGRTGFVPWQVDSIEGFTTVRQNSRLFKEWTYKYPRGQFLINAIFYKPFLDKWKKNPIPMKTRDGKLVFSTINQPRLDKLAHISRVIGMIMGVGTVIAVFLTARILFNSYLSAMFASLALAFCKLFVFYSHVGNVDCPCVFWFAWGVYFAVKSIYARRWFHFALMGFCFSFSMCTKDAMVGYVIGMIPAYWFLSIGKAKNETKRLKEIVCAVFSKKLIIAVLVFLFCYALLQDILSSPHAFAQRMSHWLGGPGVTNFNKNFEGQLSLLGKSFRQLYTSLGWPLLTVIIISIIYYTIKNPWLISFLTIPLVCFYVIVIINVKMVCPRYFLPAFVGLSLLAGKCCADWMRQGEIHILVRIMLVAFIYTCSLLYCIALDLEFLNDSRIRAERWFIKNVDRKTFVASIVRLQYEPRLHIKGFRRYVPTWKPPENDEDMMRMDLFPKYIIISTNKIRRRPNYGFRNALLKGRLNYRQVTLFRCKYLCSSKYRYLNLAGWPFNTKGWLSPEIIIYKHKQP